MNDSDEHPVSTQAILRHWQSRGPNDRMAHLVKDAWRGLTRAFQMRLSEHSVSFGHWVFLRILWEDDGLTLSRLSEEAGLMVPTAFTAIRAMERLGYVTRRQQPDSKRKVYIFLTEKGRALRESLVPLAEEVNRIATRGAPPEDVEATRRTLLLMVNNLARDELEMTKAQRKMPSTRDLAGHLPNEKET
ncbi:MAG: MarR family transcriptional regulator [Hyphomicrobiales bacterium]|nr:MarR family transcriptional regulator [Hyphomicrobiales bacterium]